MIKELLSGIFKVAALLEQEISNHLHRVRQCGAHQGKLSPMMLHDFHPLRA